MWNKHRTQRNTFKQQSNSLKFYHKYLRVRAILWKLFSIVAVGKIVTNNVLTMKRLTLIELNSILILTTNQIPCVVSKI